MNCTGYPFQTILTLCGDGPFGGGNSSDLSVDLQGGNISGSTIVAGWDGTQLEIDLLSDLPLGLFTSYVNSPSESCTITKASLTLIPDPPNTNTGIAMFELHLENCTGGNGTGVSTTTPAPTTTLAPYFNDICGSTGPHIITEMIPFTLAPGGCD